MFLNYLIFEYLNEIIKTIVIYKVSHLLRHRRVNNFIKELVFRLPGLADVLKEVIWCLLVAWWSLNRCLDIKQGR